MPQRNRSVSLKPGKSRGSALTITHPNAAGIDIGSASHFVAVPPDRDDEPVREFPSFTVDLNALADWLKACGVDTVAMESTGVYWIALFELLESRGFTVLLVNARHVKNVSGRKSDVLDCQWLQQLMTYGLLSGAFRPAEQVCVLRSLWRQREMLLKSQARHVQHMQKALTQMNIQLANVISDVAGVTGQKILRASRCRRTRWPHAGRGVDLTRIDVTTALAVLAEIGVDTSRFPTIKHFTSWLGLCPGTKITGGKVMSGKTQALRSSKSALGAYFRRLCSRMDKPKAVTAAAHKLARLIYTMLAKGQEYTDQGQDYYEARYREHVLRALSQRAAKLGMKMVAIEQPA